MPPFLGVNARLLRSPRLDTSDLSSREGDAVETASTSTGSASSNRPNAVSAKLCKSVQERRVLGLHKRCVRVYARSSPVEP